MAEGFVGTLKAALSLGIENFTRPMRQAVQQAEQGGRDMENAFGRRPQQAIRQTGEEMRRVSWTMRGYIKDTARVITGILISQTFYRLIGAVQDAAVEVHQLSQDLETLGISLKYLMGEEHGHMAPALLRELQEFAATTPYALMEAAESARALLSAGTDLNRVTAEMRILTDVASSVNAPFEDLSMLMSQIRAKGRATAEELERFAVMKIPARKILAEQMNVPLEMLSGKFLSQIPIETFMNAMYTGFLERFSGAAEEFANSWTGMMSTIKDNILFTMQGIYEPLFEYLKLNILPRLRKTMDEIRDGIENQGAYYLLRRFIPRELHAAIRTIIGSLKSLAQSFLILGQAVQPVVAAMLELVGVYLATFLPILAIVARAIAELVFALTRSSSVVRTVVGVIGGLAIAGPIAMKIYALAKGLFMLAIIKPVVSLVVFLIKALKALNIAIFSVAAGTYTALLPALGILLVLLGAVSLAFKPVRDFMKSLWKTFTEVAGIDISKILQPKDVKFVDDISGALENVQEGFEDTEEAIEDAGKAFKRFLMSFDEVYNVPELDTGAGAGEDPDASFTYPDIPFPELPDVGGWTEDFGELFTWDSIWEGLKAVWDKIKTKFLEGWFWIKDGWDQAWETWWEGYDEVKVKWDKFWADIKQGWDDAWANLAEGYEEFKQRWTTFWGGLGTSFETFRTTLSSAWTKLWKDAGDAWSDFSSTVKPAWETFWTNLNTHLGTFRTDIRKAWDDLWSNLSSAWVEFSSVVGPAWSTFWTNLNTRFGTFRTDLRTAWDDLWRNVGTAWSSFTEKVRPAWNTFWDGLGKRWSEFMTDSDRDWGKLWTDVKTLWGNFTSEVAPAWNKFWEDLDTTFGGFKTDVTTAWNDLWTNVTTEWNKFKEETEPAWNKFWEDLDTTFGGFKTDVTTAWNDLWTDIKKNWKEFSEPYTRDWRTFWEDITKWWNDFKKSFNKGWDDFWSGLGNRMRGYINVIIDYINKLIKSWNSLSFTIPGFKNPVTGTVYDATTISVPRVATIPRLARGGVVTRDTLARVGEGGPEAVLPLNRQSLQPLADLITEQIQSFGTGGVTPPIYVGTLIADRQGLRELERRLQQVRLSEQGRLTSSHARIQQR